MEVSGLGLDGFLHRFFIVAFLPTALAGLFVIVLVQAGAPGGVDLTALWRNMTHTSVAAILVALVLSLMLALLLSPALLGLVRTLEGLWPRWLRPLSSLGIWRQGRRRDRLIRREEFLLAKAAAGDEQALIDSGEIGALWRKRFPPGSTLLPTTFGNALSASEGRAGSRYGWDAVVAWPRLYPLLPDRMQEIADDRRMRMDMMVSLAVYCTVSAAATGGLLATTGYWLLLILIPLSSAALAYRSATTAAVAYGDTLEVCFDLYRFQLLEQLHVPLPADSAAEKVIAERLCLQWRQGVEEPPLIYAHPVSAELS
ncbi:hypothetical protein F4553_002002 [Allocatelliglobosispora scoriae]|uniref:Uncharacterized protein n=1 Tax=Allocatelliglobosispora scoriae TaxID=643052 RepID=A0A841BNU4_9ACTN|nr:hypothetical protein [Allocatelliglobosispora scoriae]MBB5868623.1 hypothetical protein [Allocatelliglobosispora scoriae]